MCGRSWKRGDWVSTLENLCLQCQSEARKQLSMLPGVVMSVLTYRLTATIWKEPEEYVARCSEFGVASAGDSPSDALPSLKEATELYVKSIALTDNLIPITAFLQVFS